MNSIWAVEAFQLDGAWQWVGLAAIPALVALNAFFVAAEFALVAVRKTRVEEMIQKGERGAKSILAAISNLDRSIAATQLGITLASIALGWVAERALAQGMMSWFDGLSRPWNVIATHSVAVTIAFLLVTFLHVVFGELIPKSIALQTPDRVSLWVAGPLNVFAKMTRPLILVMNGTGNAIIRLFGYRASEIAELAHSVDELALLIEDTHEAGVLAADQAEYVQNVFRLSNKTVRECMVPRDDVAALEIHMPEDKVLEAVRRGAHTRMPVYDGSLDNIVGIVNTKDLFYLFSLKNIVVLEDALYPALFLRPDENVARALQLFRRARRPMALVRDEECHILGLITLEDILEEIIGDIEDEHDRPTRKLVLRK